MGFACAMPSTARSWVDESQAAVPGYDDRIVTVYVEDDEGGLNLEMEGMQTKGLAGRGGAARRVLRRTGPEALASISEDGRGEEVAFDASGY